LRYQQRSHRERTREHEVGRGAIARDGRVVDHRDAKHAYVDVMRLRLEIPEEDDEMEPAFASAALTC
jgi:hypothetical protein